MTKEIRRQKATEIAQWLLDHDNIAIFTHTSPDGDALGSCLALKLALEILGKRAFVCNRDPVPDYLRLLPGWESVVNPAAFPFAPEAAVICDCAEISRTGLDEAFPGDIDGCVVDHHATAQPAFSPALVDPGAAAAGELIYEIIRAMGVKMTKDMAVYLYVAVVTDTGSFAFSNTTPEAMAAAAECIQLGVDVAEMNFRLFRVRGQGRTRLLGRALNGIQYLEGGQLALMKLTLSDFEETRALPADTEGVVNFGVDTDGVEVAILAVEKSDGVKFSLRSRERVDVAALLTPLGGGGHARAAGLTLSMAFDEAIGVVLNAARKALS